jgi:hypothetical protein
MHVRVQKLENSLAVPKTPGPEKEIVPQTTRREDEKEKTPRRS